jgi:hypothetical protein
VRFRTAVVLGVLSPLGCTPTLSDYAQRGPVDVGRPASTVGFAAPAVDSQTWWYATQPEPTTTTVARLRRSGTVGSASRRSSSTAECIGQRENGGDYGRSSNPTHFGKYQYDRQTWAAHGGNPDDWGTASPEEQERVFANGTARYGYSAWTKYDGC